MVRSASFLVLLLAFATDYTSSTEARLAAAAESKAIYCAAHPSYLVVKERARPSDEISFRGSIAIRDAAPPPTGPTEVRITIAKITGTTRSLSIDDVVERSATVNAPSTFLLTPRSSGRYALGINGNHVCPALLLSEVGVDVDVLLSPLTTK